MGRVSIGGVVAGLVVFCWGAAAHMALPLGAIGFRVAPNEEATVGQLQGALKEPGIYLFPGHDMSKPLSESEQAALFEKIKKGPTGFLVYHPDGGEAMSPQQLGTEAGTNIVCALLAALLLAQTRLGYVGRVLFVTGLGLFGSLIVSVPYWNWYRFPLDFTAAQTVEHVVGWFLAGLVLAAIVRPIVKQPLAE
jgi:hypothetical protein